MPPFCCVPTSSELSLPFLKKLRRLVRLQKLRKLTRLRKLGKLTGPRDSESYKTCKASSPGHLIWAGGRCGC